MAPETVCVVNIGPRGQRQRLVFGLVLFGLSAGAAATLVATGAAPAWRATLFLPLMAAGLGVFQARAKT